jgi:hypothetical protein
VQSTGITIDDSNNVTGVVGLTASGVITSTASASDTTAAIVFSGGNGFSVGSTIPGIVYNQANLCRWGVDYLGMHHVASSGGLSFTSTGAANGNKTTHITRQSDGVIQIGTTANNANGSLLLTNLTASGTVVINNATIASSSTTGALQVLGGISTQNNVQSTGDMRAFNFTVWNTGSRIGFDAGQSFFNSGGTIRVRNNANNADAPLSCSNLTASGTLRIGGGTVVANILSATATLDFPSIGSNDTETLTITVTGAVAGDSVFLGCPAGLDAGLVFCASVTAANTVTVRMHNSSGGSVNPASATFRATVIRF